MWIDGLYYNPYLSIYLFGSVLKWLGVPKKHPSYGWPWLIWLSMTQYWNSCWHMVTTGDPPVQEITTDLPRKLHPCHAEDASRPRHVARPPPGGPPPAARQPPRLAPRKRSQCRAPCDGGKIRGKAMNNSCIHGDMKSHGKSWVLEFGWWGKFRFV